MTENPRIALVTFYDAVSLGVRSLHAVLTQAGYPTDLIFFRHYLSAERPLPSEAEYRLLLEILEERQPRLVGLSFRSFGFQIAARITREVKERLPALVVWGGVHPTLAPEDCAAVADAVCVGEGEGAMLELAEALRDGRDFSGIRNLWSRQGDQVVQNPLRPLLQDLDALPFPVLGDGTKFVIENDRLLRCDPYLGPQNTGEYYLAASRGCPYQCDYCCNSAFHRIYSGAGPYVRKRSPANVLAELEQAKQQLKLHYIGFMDEVFSLDKSWTLAICQGFRERIGLPFKCEVHPQTLDEELVAGMRAAGLTYAVVGVQTGSERIRRDYYHRMMSNAEILETARLLHRYQVIPYFDFILDNPYETAEDLAASLDLVCRFPRPYNLEILSLTFFPSTELTRRALADGTIRPDQVEGPAQKTLTSLWYSLPRAYNSLHALHAVLFALSLVKLDWKIPQLGYVTARFQTSLHLFPPGLLRWLGRRSLFRRYPRLLYLPVKYGVLAGDRLLSPLRRLRRIYARRRSRSRKAS